MEEWRDWLTDNWATAGQVWVSIFNKASKRQTVTFDELLDEALCWGWVDTQTKNLDEQRYMIRFYPRKAGSNWAPTNRSRACRLIAAGRMQSSGRAALPADLTCPD